MKKGHQRRRDRPVRGGGLAASTAAADVCTGDFSGNGILDPADTADFVTALLGAS
ncbi:MAG: hypothetical protein JXQ75_08460 [Phycisphaerae bacterium]|nr:hypothetical protein [Phycisphaerae bacterium]